eukprot:2828018-Alexandrium_andersonii.AAC.1
MDDKRKTLDTIFGNCQCSAAPVPDVRSVPCRKETTPAPNGVWFEFPRARKVHRIGGRWDQVATS